MSRSVSRVRTDNRRIPTENTNAQEESLLDGDAQLDLASTR
jgi:hypothetical protein